MEYDIVLCKGVKILLTPTSWQMTIVIFRVWLYGVVRKEMIFWVKECIIAFLAIMFVIVNVSLF